MQQTRLVYSRSELKRGKSSMLPPPAREMDKRPVVFYSTVNNPESSSCNATIIPKLFLVALFFSFSAVFFFMPSNPAGSAGSRCLVLCLPFFSGKSGRHLRAGSARRRRSCRNGGRLGDGCTRCRAACSLCGGLLSSWISGGPLQRQSGLHRNPC